jgi:hypothetical protein
MEEKNETLSFGTKVEISGRTMLRPGFSLVGLTGMIYLTSDNAPEGCQTVLVDWLKHGYTPEAGYPEGSLPLLVNVPTAHLSLELTEEKPVEEKPEKKPFAPKLRVTPEVKPTDSTPNKTTEKKEDGANDGRPKLRLV